MNSHPQSWEVAANTAKPVHQQRISARERADAPRWVWAHTQEAYPALLTSGIRVSRCHDLLATERLLLGHEQRWAELGALTPPTRGTETPDELTLFDELTLTSSGPEATPHQTDSEPDSVLRERFIDQQQRISQAATTHPGFPLLVAAESAGWLAANEMTAVGLPWDVAVHDELLTELLGHRQGISRPSRLNDLAAQIAAALEDPAVNVDSNQDLLRSLRRAGLPVNSTSRYELHRHDHPAVPLVRRYKELARIWTANGWNWSQTWVRAGRFHPEYIPAGVISGRWATRGGGALQIPRALRSAVRAAPTRVLVVADAGQVEPRVLAAMSGDAGMIAATQAGDLYRELARQALRDENARAEAKVALLSAMYGGGTGSPALAAMKRRFPRALELLERAARSGEDGAGVHSILGRACPPAPPGWLDNLPDAAARARSRARGRFTRNYVVQASAADWAAVLVAGLRVRLADLPPDDGWRSQMVFFQHDEVMVETTPAQQDAVLAAITEAGAEATRLVLGDVGVRIPLDASAVGNYGEKV